MTSSQRLRKHLFVCLAALVALTGLVTTAEATHGRYGSITWSVPNPATPNVIRIRVETAWRRSFFGAPVIGTVISLGSVVVSADGGPVPSPSSYPLSATVTSVNGVEDWIMTVQETNYTFPVATANYLLSFDLCCRISTLRDGNNDQNFRLTSRVTVRMPPNAINRPPITATLPILSLPLNIASVFTIPAADPDGDTLTFRAATTPESSLPTPVPAGFAISSAGVVSFTPTVAGLYGVQIRVTDSQGAYTVVDLILSVAPPSGLRPAITINSAPGPLALSVLYGSPVSFTIGATDPENATIYLNTGTLPAGGVTSPSLPMSLVNPSTTFTWTPTFAQLGTYVLTFGATDPVGNQATTSVTITVRTNPATITCTANGSSFEAGGSPFGLTADVADPDGGTVTVRFFVDGVERQANIGVPVPGTATYVSSTFFAVGTHTYEGRVSDGASAPQSCTGAFTIVDTTPPSITVPADMTTTATSPGGAFVTHAASATDIGDPSPTLNCVPHSGSMFALGTSTVVCLAVDDSGNSSIAQFNVTVTDSTAPVITPVVTGTLGANGWYVTNPSLSWTLVDPESAIASSTGCTTQPAIGDTMGLTVTCEATNGAGLTASASTTLKVDTTVPVSALTVTTATHADGSVEATAPFGAVVTYAATASDITSGSAGTPICVPASGSVFPIGTSTVICTATDQAGNLGSNSLPIRVVDTIAPVLTVPAAISTAGTTPGGGFVTYSATAFDLATPAVVVTCTPASGSLFAYGATPVSCTATDAAGNSSSAAFTVTVTDPTPPVVTPVVVGAAGANGWYVSTPTLSWSVVDAETGVPSATGCGVQAALADTTGVTFTCQATNGHNLTTSVSVTLKVDTVKPLAAIAVTTPTHGNGSVEATSPTGAMVSYAVSVTDGTSGDSGGSTCMPASGSILAVGTTTVSCVAIDAAGNMNNQSFSITVVDTTAPNILPGPLPNPVAEATSPAGAVVSYATPGILDVVDTNPTVVCAPISGSTFPLGATSITCSATDASGNSATYPGMFTVTVQDTTPPALALDGPAIQRVEGATPYVELGAAALDLFDGDVTAQITIDSSAVNANAVGTYTVFYSVTDAAGNTAQLTRTVSVEDATPPVMPALSNITTEATGPAGAATTFVVADANDTVAGAVALVCSTPSGSTFVLGTTTVSCTATDPSGNQASGGFTVTVVDTTAPDLTVPANIDVPGIAPSGVGVTFAAAATDAVTSPLVVGCLPASGSVFTYGTTTVSCSVADAAGNTSNGSFTVTVTDPTPPVVTAVVTGTLGSNGWYTSDVNVSWVVTDPESNLASTGCGPAVVSADGTAAITCSATSEGGTTAVTQVVNRDVTAPAITTPASLTAEATGASGAVVTYAAATAVETVSGLNGAVVCAPVSGSVFPIATTSVTCSAADLAGNTSSASFTVTVRDTTSPVISATAPSAGQLWPPNHQMVPLTVAVSATDITSTPVCTVTGVTSDEPQNGLGDGDTPIDWLLTGPVSLQLRAERAGNGDGRVYTVAVSCTDGFGNATTASTTVGVAKSQGKK